MHLFLLSIVTVVKNPFITTQHAGVYNYLHTVGIKNGISILIFQ